MDKKDCKCDGKESLLTCRECNSAAPMLYWCETCQQLVTEKRCKRCGLKTRKVLQTDQK